MKGAMAATRPQLRRKLVAAFVLVALLAAVCFSLFCLLFVYTVEDRFFDRMLEREVAHQQRSMQAAGRWAAPLNSGVSLYIEAAAFPPDLARQPQAQRGGEFYGEQGRHYHVRRLGLAGQDAWLVAEVSGELVVRPRLPFILAVLGGGALLIMAITAGAGWWLARRVTAPLQQLAQLAQAAQPGRLPQGFAQTFPADETGALAAALEQSWARTAAFIEREQHFTRDASHELRTPLAVAEGAGYLLAQQALPAPAMEQVQRIRAACAQMGQSVRTLLALAREGQGDWGPQAVPLLPLVEQAVIRHAHLLDSAALEVQVSVPPAALGHCHAPSLEILLDNLVANAASHAGGGTLHIYIEEGWLVVRDEGPGLDGQVAGKLGQAGARREGSPGHGLGLSIAHRLGVRAGIAVRIANAEGGGVRAALHVNAA